jgi:heptosyltransferase-1
MNPTDAILVIRLGAMGDIIHALPAVTSLKQSFPQRKLIWLVAPRWLPLLEGNPSVDELIPVKRSSIGSLGGSWRKLRALRPGLAVDFQGLVKSALLGRISGPKEFLGFDRSVAREPLASAFYTHQICVKGPHRVQRNVQLIEAAGANNITWQSWLPEGLAEGQLPAGDFVLASPFAGWNSKQWPLEHYEALAKRLQGEGLQLVANVPAVRAHELAQFRHLTVHVSSVAGLIYATRRAAAVVGLDSGPLHLAAALHKPGVALFGPTDPAQTGPFNSSIIVLRSPDVQTSYRRAENIHHSMHQISVDQVTTALHASLSSVAVRQP